MSGKIPPTIAAACGIRGKDDPYQTIWEQPKDILIGRVKALEELCEIRKKKIVELESKLDYT